MEAVGGGGGHRRTRELWCWVSGLWMIYDTSPLATPTDLSAEGSEMQVETLLIEKNNNVEDQILTTVVDLRPGELPEPRENARHAQQIG